MVFPLHAVTTSAQESKKLGAQIGAYLLAIRSGEESRVVCLYGELGSGKTTLVQGLALGLGITKRLLSPTFIIVRHYDVVKAQSRLYHVDLYRLQREEDIVSTGVREIFDDPHVFVCVEWPERLGSELPERRIEVRCAVRADGAHVFDIDRI